MSTGDRLLDIFQEETLERLDSLESGLLTLEKNTENGSHELINSIFRDAHSVKAGSNLLKLRNIEELSHTLENMLELIRSTDLVPTELMITASLEAVDKLRGLAENIMESDSKSIRLQKMMLEVSLKRALAEEPEEFEESED
ncbi:two-component system, chemotaxis family, sensor kinase CheA [Maridesulfovibrio ferrireducens]|uniref:Two-component system, chemotaxis family, sensor kinase CheA n=1 Tax=Maridesulfovibrio ferrireducens TaxID=246191 RepID=A0A1G9KAC3_9BACT|nr:Hpt domain-containing protein [Maridesulfovibrio ferrireducens]SDL46681.1 two-component system, chemotaxis family, sensor kinase CheA [Maridesulfovibrio ferrireducens]